MNSARTSRLWLVLAALAVLTCALVLWLRSEVSKSPSLVTSSPEASLETKYAHARPPNAQLPALRLIPAVIDQGAANPCVRGAIRSLATNTPIAGAELTFETTQGASLASTNAAGEFEARVPEGALRLASIAAAGFHTWSPAWGHSPVVMTPAPGACVSGLVFFLEPKVKFVGTVVTLAREPVEGARVTIHARNLPVSTPLVTGKDGEFSFDAPDDATLVATHPNFEPGRVDLGLVASVTHEVRIVLGPPRERNDAGEVSRDLLGVVLDARDAGVPAALVTLRSVSEAASGDSFDTLEQTTESDADGHFVFHVTEGTAWVIGAEAEGAVGAERETHGEPVELHLHTGGTIVGTVATSGGQPVASFAVTVSRKVGAFEVWPPRVMSFVDPAGRFEVRGVAAGANVVTAAAFGLASAQPVTVEVVAGGKASVALTLARGGALKGRVVSRDGGVALAGARVSLEGGNGGEVVPLVAETRTGSDGAFTLTGIPAGRHSVFVAASNHNARLLAPADFRDDETNGPVTVDLSSVAPGEEPQLELQGIGAALKAEGSHLVITRVLPGGGAAEVGLAPDDQIIAIDGVDVAVLGFAGSIERIRGPENTTVELVVQRPGIERLTVPRRRLTH